MANKFEVDSAFKKFLKENKSFKYMFPILFVLIILLILFYSGAFRDPSPSSEAMASQTASASENALSGQPQVEVLPQIIRSTNEESIKVGKDPFETPMKLAGVIYTGERSSAIVESGNVSYIVQLNDTIGESSWTVTLIEADSITLESNGKSVDLTLSDTATNNQQNRAVTNEQEK